MEGTLYSSQILITTEFSLQIFGQSSNIKFHKIPSSKSRVIPCGRTYVTNLTVAFRNVANAP